MTESSRPKFLLVKLSSLGDVLHNLPIVWDIRERFPNAQIDWVVEEGYLDLLKPLQSKREFKGVDRIIPIALRRWKKNIFSSKNWNEFKTFIQTLRKEKYDEVIDFQGLIKSAVVCFLAKRSDQGKTTGLANATEYSAYEPTAQIFYSQSVQVPKQCHAIGRSRYLLSSACQIPLIDRTVSPKFYSKSIIDDLFQKNISDDQTKLVRPYVLCFHATARDAKKWDLNNWIIVGKYLIAKGFNPVFPWGNAFEKQTSEDLVSQIGGGIVPQAFSVAEYFGIITNAALTIGVDTGLTHLSAVLNQPTIEIYCDSPVWKTEGFWSEKIINLGDTGKPPSADEVITAVDRLI
jgi:heptosyltransferase-1